MQSRWRCLLTLSDLREWLEVLADADAAIPARVVLERLPVVEGGVGGDTLAALDVQAAGEALGRSASTVRQYARQGLLEGAYRQRGREWRIPRSAIGAFHRQQHRDSQDATKTVSGKDTADLSAWRKEIDAA